jgi:hypothetical protein
MKKIPTLGRADVLGHSCPADLWFGDHVQVREGIRLLMDRQLPAGMELRNTLVYGMGCIRNRTARPCTQRSPVMFLKRGGKSLKYLASRVTRVRTPSPSDGVFWDSGPGGGSRANRPGWCMNRQEKQGADDACIPSPPFLNAGEALGLFRVTEKGTIEIAQSLRRRRWTRRRVLWLARGFCILRLFALRDVSGKKGMPDFFFSRLATYESVAHLVVFAGFKGSGSKNRRSVETDSSQQDLSNLIWGRASIRIRWSSGAAGVPPCGRQKSWWPRPGSCRIRCYSGRVGPGEFSGRPHSFRG